MNCSKMVAVAFLMMMAAFGQTTAAGSAPTAAQAKAANKEVTRLAAEFQKQGLIWLARVEVANDAIKKASTPDAIETATAAKLVVVAKNLKEARGYKTAVTAQFEIQIAFAESACYKANAITAARDASNLTDAEAEQFKKCMTRGTVIAQTRDVVGSQFDKVLTMLEEAK